MAEHFDIIVVGGGPAGLTAAIYARRAGRSVLLLEKATRCRSWSAQAPSRSSPPVSKP